MSWPVPAAGTYVKRTDVQVRVEHGLRIIDAKLERRSSRNGHTLSPDQNGTWARSQSKSSEEVDASPMRNLPASVGVPRFERCDLVGAEGLEPSLETV